MNQDATVTFRPRGRYPFYFFSGVVTVAFGYLVSLNISDDRVDWGDALLISIVATLTWVSISLARARVVLSDQSLDICAPKNELLGVFLTVHSARLPWEDVWGVEVYEVPNPVSTTGVALRYVIHTARGRFDLNNTNWPKAAQIAEGICRQTGRTLNELSESAMP